MTEYSKNPAIISKIIDDEQILLNTETGDYYGLNELGSAIWELINENNDLQSMVQTLLEDYDVEESVLKDDIETFLRALIERNIINEIL